MPIPSGESSIGDKPSNLKAISEKVDWHAAYRKLFANEGLHYTQWQQAVFFTALQTKGFVILSGISGTGKTKIAQAFSAALPQPDDGRNVEFLTVRPDWRDSKSLLGYHNPITDRYEWTPFLRFLLRASESWKARDGLAWFVILDEMDLAHVEHYFAELLSVLESGRDDEGWTREAIHSVVRRGGIAPGESQITAESPYHRHGESRRNDPCLQPESARPGVCDGIERCLLRWVSVRDCRWRFAFRRRT